MVDLFGDDSRCFQKMAAWCLVKSSFVPQLIRTVNTIKPLHMFEMAVIDFDWEIQNELMLFWWSNEFRVLIWWSCSAFGGPVPELVVLFLIWWSCLFFTTPLFSIFSLGFQVECRSGRRRLRLGWAPQARVRLGAAGQIRVQGRRRPSHSN